MNRDTIVVERPLTKEEKMRLKREWAFRLHEIRTKKYFLNPEEKKQLLSDLHSTLQQ